MRIFDSLRYPSYRLYWMGSVSEHFGEYMVVATLLWMTNEISSSPFLLTLVGSCRLMPIVFLSVLGGLAADRLNRRNLLIAALLGSVLLSISLAVLAATDRITVLYIIVAALLHGVLTSFNHPARLSIVPNLVEKEHLLNAISLESGSVIASQAIAMPVAGYLIASMGTAPVFSLNALCVLLAIWWLVPIKNVSIAHTIRKRALSHDLVEGGRYVREHLVILVLVLLFLLPRISTNSYMSLLPIFAVDVLHVGPSGYGFLQGAAGWGSFIGFIALASSKQLRRKGLLLLSMAMIMGISLGGFATSGLLPLSLFFLFLVGALNTCFIILDSTLIQSIIPDDIRGRIMSLAEVIRGLGPAGSLLFGLIGEQAGAPFAILILGAICCFIPLGLVFLFPQLRDVE